MLIVASSCLFGFSKKRFSLELMLRCVSFCLRTLNLVHPGLSFDLEVSEDPHDTVQDNKYDNNNAGVMSLLTM